MPSDKPTTTTKERPIRVRKLGMSVKPPFLFMIYREPMGKYRERKMPIRDFSVTTNVSRVARAMKARHKPYLDSIPNVRIEKLLRMIQECQKVQAVGEQVDIQAIKATIDEEYALDGSKDLNKVSPEELKRQKEIMEDSFQKAAVAPGDSEFVYDKRVEFEAQNKKNSEWDSDAEDEEKAVDSKIKGGKDGAEKKGDEEEEEVGEELEVEAAEDVDETKKDEASDDDDW